MSGMRLLVVQELCAWYGPAQVLHGLNFEVLEGEVVSLVGPNGAGKSSTLKALMGLMPRRSGHLWFMGETLDQARPHAVAQRGIGYVPEDRRVFGDLTVLENLQVARQPARRWPNGRQAPYWDVEAVLRLFPPLRALQQRAAHHLSGGEQQMLTVARTLMGQPLLVLLDEPSEGVAPVLVAQMADMVRTLKAHGVSVLLSEQNRHFADAVSDRRLVLAQGVLQSERTPG